MSPKDRQESIEKLVEGGILANKFGPLIIEESKDEPAVSVICAAILFSTFCAAAEMTLHDAMGIFMEVHKQTARMAEGIQK